MDLQAIQEQKQNNKATHEILQVSQLNTLAKQLLEGKFNNIWIEGEISNVARPQSGHVYLTLKDSQAQIKGAFFKQAQRGCRLELQNGQQVLVKAKVSLYAPRGDYQLIISQIEAAGAGQLQHAFEALKKKLQSEGLFNSEHKQSIPEYPHRIGVVTSPSGAALQDILHVLERRFPLAELIIYPTLVQGTNAASQIAQMIDIANERQEVDLLLVGRGGGSLEDLWPFNEEIVARALYQSRLPTISAVGHQTDFTIADFVADIRAPTPSAAAELATPDWQELYTTFAGFEQSFIACINRIIESKYTTVNALARHIKHPQSQIQEHMQRLDHLEQRLHQSLKQYFLNIRHKLVILSQRLTQQSPHNKISQYQKELQRLTVSLKRNQTHFLQQKRQLTEHLGLRLTGMGPQKTLERGYLIAKNERGEVIEKAADTTMNQRLTLQFKDGSIKAQII